VAKVYHTVVHPKGSTLRQDAVVHHAFVVSRQGDAHGPLDTMARLTTSQPIVLPEDESRWFGSRRIKNWNLRKMLYLLLTTY